MNKILLLLIVLPLVYSQSAKLCATGNVRTGNGFNNECADLETNETCIQTCSEGYEDNNFGNGQTYSCPDGEFTGTLLACIPKNCAIGNIPTGDGYGDHCSSLETDSSCLHTCDNGYTDNNDGNGQVYTCPQGIFDAVELLVCTKIEEPTYGTFILTSIQDHQIDMIYDVENPSSNEGKFYYIVKLDKTKEQIIEPIISLDGSEHPVDPSNLTVDKPDVQTIINPELDNNVICSGNFVQVDSTMRSATIKCDLLRGNYYNIYCAVDSDGNGSDATLALGDGAIYLPLTTTTGEPTFAPTTSIPTLNPTPSQPTAAPSTIVPTTSTYAPEREEVDASCKLFSTQRSCIDNYNFCMWNNAEGTCDLYPNYDCRDWTNNFLCVNAECMWDNIVHRCFAENTPCYFIQTQPMCYISDDCIWDQTNNLCVLEASYTGPRRAKIKLQNPVPESPKTKKESSINETTFALTCVAISIIAIIMILCMRHYCKKTWNKPNDLYDIYLADEY